jgi:predicted DNA-binding transcriptional regulator AlpA
MLLETDDYLTLTEVKNLLGVSRWTVYNFITREWLSGGKKLPGGGRVFLRSEAQALKDRLANGKAKPNAPD